VVAGRLGDGLRRADAGGSPFPSAAEVLAHECGHTWQARRLGWAYWPVGAAVTLFREGLFWWNHFDYQASELGQFGGVVNGSVHPELMSRITNKLKKPLGWWRAALRVHPVAFPHISHGSALSL
jgi:hypothetical protein